MEFPLMLLSIIMLLFCISGKDTRENCAAIFRTTMSGKKRHTVKADAASDIENEISSTAKGIADDSANDTTLALPPVEEYQPQHFASFQQMVLRIAIGGGFAIVFVIIFTLLYCCFRRGSKEEITRKKTAKHSFEKDAAEQSTSTFTEPGETHEMITATSTVTAPTRATSVSGHDLTTSTATTGHTSL